MNALSGTYAILSRPRRAMLPHFAVWQICLIVVTDSVYSDDQLQREGIFQLFFKERIIERLAVLR